MLLTIHGRAYNRQQSKTLKLPHLNLQSLSPLGLETLLYGEASNSAPSEAHDVPKSQKNVKINRACAFNAEQ